MTLRRRIIDWTLTGLLIVIPALVLRASLSRESPSFLDTAMLRITAPLQTAVSWVVEGIGGMWSGYVALIDVEDENEELRAENEKLRKELAQVTRRAYDVEALEELAQVKKQTPADTVGARVIAAPMTPNFRVLRLRIDRGKNEITPKMAVIAGTGPVGTIETVFGDYADVRLISDSSSKIDVIVKRTGRLGWLIGKGKHDSYACRIESLSLPANLEERAKVGDEIVTSGKGSPFPAGLTIGKITKLDGDNGMVQYVEVEPVVDVSLVRSVLVLLAKPPPEDPDAKTKRRSEPAFGVKPL
ncbi:MAG TPA: rod shape-determining protein MreC [Kofleriaceae bacterium]